MSPKLKHFPAGTWRVLFGGHVQLGTAPTPEHVYYVPIARVSEKGFNFMYVKVGLGDLPLITPNTMFQDGRRIEADTHQALSLHIHTGKEAHKQERTLGRFLETFMADHDPLGYLHSLSLASKRLSSLAEAPVIVFKTTTPNLWAVAPAAEWYRHVYGLTDYLAHTFLMPSFQDIENQLVVNDRTRIIPRSDVNHPLLPKVDEILAIVPRTRVPDRCAPLYTSIKLATKELGNLAQRNSLYAAQSIRAAAASGRTGPYWLRFGHPYPNRIMPVTGRGIRGTFTTTDKNSEIQHAIFLTSIVRHSHPPELPYCILERENDGNSISKIGGDHPLPCDESEIQKVPRFEVVTDEEHGPSILTPDANPRAGQVAIRYEGAPFDDTGTPQIIKLQRTGVPDPSLIRRVQQHDLIIDSGDRTTNQIETETSTAGPAAVEPESNSELKNAQSLASLMVTLASLESDKTICNLMPVNYSPSQFSINGITLQKIPSSPDSERWLKMPDRKENRLILAVRFEYKNCLFVVLDVERRGTASFSGLLAKYFSDQPVDDSLLYSNVITIIEKLRNAKGNFVKAGIKDEFFEVQALKHHKEIYKEVPRVRRSYVLDKLNSMVTNPVPD